MDGGSGRVSRGGKRIVGRLEEIEEFPRIPALIKKFLDWAVQ
jgi:hypothetical protein